MIACRSCRTTQGPIGVNGLCVLCTRERIIQGRTRRLARITRKLEEIRARQDRILAADDIREDGTT